MEEKKWYNQSVSETLESLASGPDGLADEEAKRRLAEHGFNELREENKISPWVLLAGQFKNVLIIILLVAVVLSVIIGVINYRPGGGFPEEITDAIVIFAIVIAVVILGFIQEFRSEKAVAALKKMTALTATVVRNGEDMEIPAREIVPGDVVMLSRSEEHTSEL